MQGRKVTGREAARLRSAAQRPDRQLSVRTAAAEAGSQVKQQLASEPSKQPTSDPIGQATSTDNPQAHSLPRLSDRKNNKENNNLPEAVVCLDKMSVREIEQQFNLGERGAKSAKRKVKMKRPDMVAVVQSCDAAAVPVDVKAKAVASDRATAAALVAPESGPPDAEAAGSQHVRQRTTKKRRVIIAPIKRRGAEHQLKEMGPSILKCKT